MGVKKVVSFSRTALSTYTKWSLRYGFVFELAFSIDHAIERGGFSYFEKLKKKLCILHQDSYRHLLKAKVNLKKRCHKTIEMDWEKVGQSFGRDKLDTLDKL